MEWGAGTFCRSLRSRIRMRRLVDSEAAREQHNADWEQLPSPPRWNVVVLGPAGAGKSSLIYTWWRSLQDSAEATGAEASSQKDVLSKLHVGWSVGDVVEGVGDEAGATRPRGGLRSKHGTKALSLFELLQPTEESAGIYVQDTKGQQFFDERELNHAGNLLKGTLMEGSNQEQENFRYWFSIGQIGFFAQSSLNTSPHVVVLVFDIMLRSLQRMINGSEADSPQLKCYCHVIRQAQREGLEVFVALTHMDVYERTNRAAEAEDGVSSPPSSPGADTRVGESVQNQIGELSAKLSQALSSGGAHVPHRNIFVVENYNVTKNSTDDRIELAALELLEVLVESADRFLLLKCPPKRGCVLS